MGRVATNKTGLNVGSGQRRFESVAECNWINIDCVSRPPDQVPDLICNVGVEPLPYDSNSIDYVVLHQVYEHFGLGEGHGVIREANRVLRDGGSLILTVPWAKRLAERRALEQISDYIYAVNIMGAYQGEEGDRHKWVFWDSAALRNDVADAMSPESWKRFCAFDWREIPGANIARDWWILGLEVIK